MSQTIFPSKLSFCHYHEQYHSFPTTGNFCEQNTIENLYFQIHSLLARKKPGWTFSVSSWVNEWPFIDLIYLSLFIHIWFVLCGYWSQAFVFQHLEVLPGHQLRLTVHWKQEASSLCRRGEALEGSAAPHGGRVLTGAWREVNTFPSTLWVA